MGAQDISLWQLLGSYLLLVLTLFVMQRMKIGETAKLLIASVRMTVQLVLAGIVLQVIFAYPHPLFTIAYLVIIQAFAIHTMLKTCRSLNRRFKLIAALSLTGVGVGVLIVFVCFIVGQNFFNPQYTITLSGMIIGNAMTGLSLALKAFQDDLQGKKAQIYNLLNLGVHPRVILRPLINNALVSALMPTMNSMVGMGIIFLPGMMTGQILSGTPPTTAIAYQIAIMISICASACLAVFFTLYFGHKTLYNKDLQIFIPAEK